MSVPRTSFAAPATIAATIMVGRLFFNLQNSFLSMNGEVMNSEGSKGSSSNNRHRGVLNVENSRAIYPLQPVQVGYSVDMAKHTDVVERAAANRDASSDSDLKRPNSLGLLA